MMEDEVFPFGELTLKRFFFVKLQGGKSLKLHDVASNFQLCPLATCWKNQWRCVKNPKSVEWYCGVGDWIWIAQHIAALSPQTGSSTQMNLVRLLSIQISAHQRAEVIHSRATTGFCRQVSPCRGSDHVMDLGYSILFANSGICNV